MKLQHKIRTSRSLKGPYFRPERQEMCSLASITSSAVRPSWIPAPNKYDKSLAQFTLEDEQIVSTDKSSDDLFV